MTNQVTDGESIAFLYAVAVLTRMFTAGIITPKVYETAFRKARLRFTKISFAV